MNYEVWDPDLNVDQLIKEYDETTMPLPDMENEPHLLISKVRKHYMEYIIKLLSINYENHQQLLNKNIYLPSAIWRCAKSIELSAAQTCMVVQLYRKNIITVIKQLKNDTKKRRLHTKLSDCLRRPPSNEKKLQTTLSKSSDCMCQCTCNQRKRRRKTTDSPKIDNQIDSEVFKDLNSCTKQYKIPVLISQNECKKKEDNSMNITTEVKPVALQNKLVTNMMNINPVNSPKVNTGISTESQDSDELMLQLEKLFQADPNDDDLFEGTLCDTMDIHNVLDDSIKKPNEVPNDIESNSVIKKHDSVIENHSAQIKSLDDRLASLAGILSSNNDTVPQQKQDAVKAKRSTSKWLCEEYYLKAKFYELLDEIGDTNRKKLSRIKAVLLELFGPEGDDEGVLSPLEETPEFVISCKERIAPWVVKLLTPYYIKGRIRGKALFKAVAKHLIRLIYQCSHYPREYEVSSFVSDFLHNHKLIRCEADFKHFRIDNI